MKLQEGALEVDFSNAIAAEQLDRQGISRPQGMRFVDWKVEQNENVLLIEVKDPSAGRADGEQEYLKRVVSSAIADNWVPKARDSYTYLHLMRKDTKPFDYIVLLGVNPDAELLTVINDKLLSRLRQEGEFPWARRYIRRCMVVTPRDWERHFSRYPLRRIPSPAT